MKLSELSTDRALDVLCELTPYVSNITDDKELMDTLGKELEISEGMNLYGQVGVLAGRIGELAPLLLRTHRTDVYGILSAINERTPAEIAAQPVMDTIRQARELFQDIDLMSFFRSSARQGQSEPSAPSADCPASA